MLEQSSAFDTSFAMLHSLSTLKSECERIVNDARHRIGNVAQGLECEQLPPDRAVEILRDVEESLSRLSR
jgi:hypothetical protein